MKLSRFFCVLLFSTLGLLAAAGEPVYLRLEGGKAKPRVCAVSGGVLVLGDLPAGTYTVTVCDKEGKPSASDAAAVTELKARDAASGQASGKRQHKPISIVKEWGRSSPALQFVVPEDGATVELHTKTATKSRSNIQNN